MDDQNQPPKPPGYPEPPNQGPRLRPNERDVRDLKVAQNLVMVASIAGPVSLFIGGVFLATAGLVCAIIALKKLNALSTRLTDVAAPAKRLKRSCIIGIAVCSIALVLNAVSAYLTRPCSRPSNPAITETSHPAPTWAQPPKATQLGASTVGTSP